MGLRPVVLSKLERNYRQQETRYSQRRAAGNK